MATPGNIRLQSLEQAQGYGFVSVATGMPIYVLHGSPKVATEWTPLYASDIALPVGDFTTAKNADGTRQWAYKGQRLYTYNGDYSATDINGLTAQKDAQIALAYRFFIPDAIVISALADAPADDDHGARAHGVCRVSVSPAIRGSRDSRRLSHLLHRCEAGRNEGLRGRLHQDLVARCRARECTRLGFLGGLHASGRLKAMGL